MGSDFSGLGSFELAAERVGRVIGRTTVNMFSCDVNRHCQKMLLENHRPFKFYPDITQRDHQSMDCCDWYGAGFPCQPFSSAGLGLGVDDCQKRGLLVADSLAYVVSKRPSLVVYENVKGIMDKKHASLLQWVIKTLEDNSYRVYTRLLNTQDFGIPHHRLRLYIVGIKSSRLRRAFRWPAPIPCPPLDEFLGHDGDDGRPGFLLAYSEILVDGSFNLGSLIELCFLC